MRMLSKRQLKELVLYSPQHVARLEAAGAFPKRVQLGQCRVGWIEQGSVGLVSKSVSRAEIRSHKTPDDGVIWAG